MAKKTAQKKTRREKRKDAGVVVLSPRITEKGTLAAEHNAYVFNVLPHANKKEVARAIEEMFKVRPREVHIVRSAGKRKFTRGTSRFGHSAVQKKAYVYLKKGETIDIS